MLAEQGKGHAVTTGLPHSIFLCPALAGTLSSKGRRPRMIHSLLLVAALMPSAEQAAPMRVGQIIIVGNEVMPSDMILNRLSLVPSRVVSPADLRTAAWKLGILQLYGIHSPSVVFLDSDGMDPFKDILVRVHETPVTWFLLGLPQDILFFLFAPKTAR
jgi:hypothetical protein